MATIKFYPYQKKGKSKIYVRITIKRGYDFRLSTPLSIQESSKWDAKSGYPKKTNDQNKLLFKELIDLENYIDQILSEIEHSKTETTNDVSSKWLRKLILDYFNESPISDSDLLIPFAKSYAQTLYHKSYIRNGIRIKYSKNTINKYLNFVKVLENYQNHLKVPIRINTVNDQFANSFLNYLMDVQKRSINTRGRYVKRLKTIIKEAELAGLKVDIKYKHIKGFEDETVVTFLTFQEIDQIIKTKMPNERLERAKDWLIIGCFTAQRISDLFRMNEKMITEYNGHIFISLKQFKTKKNVLIPVHYKVVSILKKYENMFPPNFSDNEQSNRSILSSLMKKVCEESGVNEKVRGRFNGKIGIYPKYKLIQNHTCRRSFASNFYGLEGWTTPMIMEITGHVTEKNFLKYIDKDNCYLSIKAAENFEKMKETDLISKSKTPLRKV
ncbi:tyrosine-type recombinase/integrase [Gaetbulibacter sp. M235]|uniref:tyrosine-type recombinase/integrase n=1 Tax=Gaetbulibacter sp. M235 TaxID=3126510 RepID=UPI00374F9F9E